MGICFSSLEQVKVQGRDLLTTINLLKNDLYYFGTTYGEGKSSRRGVEGRSSD